MSPQVYQLIHHLGLLLVFTSLGGMASVATSSADDAEKKFKRRPWAIAHGVGLLVLFFGGFGSLPSAGVSHGGAWPVWVFGKLVVWLALGGIPVLLRRVSSVGQLAVIVIPVLGLIAVYFVTFRPG